MEHKTTLDNFILHINVFGRIENCFLRPNIDTIYNYAYDNGVIIEKYHGDAYNTYSQIADAIDIRTYECNNHKEAWELIFDLSMEPLEINAHVIKPLTLKEYFIQHIKRTKTPVCNKHLLYLDQVNIHYSV